MPHHILAAILIQLNQPHAAKQQLICLEYALAASLDPFGVCHHADEALSMVMAGTVAAVITAVDPGGSLAEDVARFGGQLHIVRPDPPRRTNKLEERILRSGLDTTQIATLLQVPPDEVRRRRRRYARE